MAPTTRARAAPKAVVQKTVKTTATTKHPAKPMKVAKITKTLQQPKKTIDSAYHANSKGNQENELPETDEEEPSSTTTSRKLKTISNLGTIHANWALGRNNNYAEYNSEHGRFTFSANLSSNKSFALEQTTFLSGPYKGYQALILVPVPEHKFPFMELPPELRNMIYTFLLAPKGYDISLRGKKAGNFQARFQARATPQARARPSLTQGLAMLSVSKEIHEEAASVFYGCNRFVAYGFPALMSFLVHNRPHLRDVKVEQVEPKYSYSHRKMEASILAASVQLAKSQDLTHLEFDLSDVTNTLDTKEVGNRTSAGLVPIMKMLAERGEDVSKILNVITLSEDDSCKPSHAYLAHSLPLTKGCRYCTARKRRFEELQALLEENVKAFLDQLEYEIQEEAIAKAQAKRDEIKRKLQAAEPAVRRDTGRPKRQGVTDHMVSYVEPDIEDEDEDDKDGKDDDGEDGDDKSDDSDDDDTEEE
ncbi:hypothetical protein BDV97DRAFT_194971 [Delphinella strobiligena]|nr:hypothetical protein BDV97DRAFT_194971 [Delphinella strobiligena]